MKLERQGKTVLLFEEVIKSGDYDGRKTDFKVTDEIYEKLG